MLKQQSPRCRKRKAQHPRLQAKQRADRLIRDYLEVRGYDSSDIIWILGKLVNHYNINMNELTAATMDHRTRKSFVIPVPDQDSSSTSALDSHSVFTSYLHRMDAGMLAELIPTEVRHMLINRYVENIELFWSSERCTLVKNALRISERNWVWMRQLLGRSVTSEGKVVDHRIDGVTIPLLKGKHTLSKFGESAATDQGTTDQNAHGGLVSLRDAR